MGLLISKPTGKLSCIPIRVLLVIFKKEVIEKKLFNTLSKLEWGHGNQGGFSVPHPWTLCPILCCSSLQQPQLGPHPWLGLPHPTQAVAWPQPWLLPIELLSQLFSVER